MCLAQGHNAVTLMRLEPAAARSQVKHSTTEPLLSLSICVSSTYCLFFYFFIIYHYSLNIDIFLNICPRTSAQKRNIYGGNGSPCLQPRFRRKKVSKGAKIRNRYNQVPHLTQDTNGKVTNSQLDTTRWSALSKQVTTRHI